MKKHISTFLFGVLSLFLFLNLEGCKGRDKEGDRDSKDTTEVKSPVTYNIYVENSGSMAGYCNISDKDALETLLQDYYDRINSNKEGEETITVNVINTEIETSVCDKRAFLQSVKKKCSATYTKLDDMLELMMSNVTDDDVNIMVSDYVFTTNDGNFLTASSAITSLFSQQLKKNNIAVAIFKYMRNFSGKYYPGGINCNKPLPIYVWIFGRPDEVRKVSKMSFQTSNCGEYFLQTSYNAPIELSAKSKRMIQGNTIKVSEWESVRHENYYEFDLVADLRNTLLSEEEILNAHRYVLKSSNTSEFEISSISKIGDDKYKYTIRTLKPAPGKLIVSNPIIVPEWIESSNYSGGGIPSDSTTLGISYLIDGVSNAFKDVSGKKFNYYEFEVELK